jgi:tyrosyl-tRNA synthetase
MNNFIDIIKERGFVHQMTDEAGLSELLKTKGQTAYIGFDCTAKSLHVGSLLQIMLLRWWQKCGHRPIVLLGGGTTKIGDPSGKDESRPPLTDAQINENMDCLKQVFAERALPNGDTCGFIKFGSGDADAIMVNNDEWLSGLNYAQFLREYGRHFSINRMLTMDSVKLRLEREQHLSFLEFNYMILQAYDFVELNKRLGCRVQMGGSDQWGNIINGVELHKRIEIRKHWGTPAILNKLEFVETTGLTEEAATKKAQQAADSRDDENYEQYKVFGITSPLLTTSSGAKMGKTAAGAVWLNADLVSPYDYWQYWRNTEDGDVIRFLKLFTELPLEEIAEYQSWVGSSKINDAKIILATEATALLHGREEAEKAARTAAETFSGSGVSADLPTIELNIADFPPTGWPLYDLLVRAGFAASNGEARRLIKGNGVSVNDAKASDDNTRLSAADFAQGFAKLSKGKKQHVLVKLA